MHSMYTNTQQMKNQISDAHILVGLQELQKSQLHRNWKYKATKHRAQAIKNRN